MTNYETPVRDERVVQYEEFMRKYAENLPTHTSELYDMGFFSAPADRGDTVRVYDEEDEGE